MRVPPLALVAVLLLAAPAGAAGKGCLTPADAKPTAAAAGWKVCLKPSRELVKRGTRVELVAQTNAPIGADRVLSIVDVTARDAVEVCFDAQICRARVEFDKATSRRFVAAVAETDGPRLLRTKPVRVTWVDLRLELGAYATDAVDNPPPRGPTSAAPGLVWGPDGVLADSVDLDMPVQLHFGYVGKLPRDAVLLVWRGERPSTGGPQLVDTLSTDILQRCDKPDCAITAELGPRFSGEAPDTRYVWHVSLHASSKSKERDRPIVRSNSVDLRWRDWTPAVQFEPGPRTCDAGGKNCRYVDSTLSASVLQPLDPGVVLLLYWVKDCMPKPGAPDGDPSCPQVSPKVCTPGQQLCAWTGDVPAGWRPGAIVLHNTPRPMLVFAYDFLPTLA